MQVIFKEKKSFLVYVIFQYNVIIHSTIETILRFQPLPYEHMLG